MLTVTSQKHTYLSSILMAFSHCVLDDHMEFYSNFSLFHFYKKKVIWYVIPIAESVWAVN